VAALGEVWWAFEGDSRAAVVVVSDSPNRAVTAMYVVASAGRNLDGVAMELPIGEDEGIEAGVIRVAVAQPGKIMCSWLVTLDEEDLTRQAGVLQGPKVAKLRQMLDRGGLLNLDRP
jgi:mRNA-degrading endonuclease toxin of MazEF toxin-antitoxin module